MNIIRIQKIGSRLHILGAKREWLLDTDLTSGAVQEIAELLAAIEVEGIILETEAAASDRLPLLSFRKSLSEELNCPVILPEERLDSLEASFVQERHRNVWEVSYHGYNSGKDEYAQESLMTVGNGFIGLRGTIPEMRISDDCYPATYLAGLYNTASSVVNGQEIVNEDFVNAPNLQYMTIEVAGERLDFSKSQITELTRSVNMQTGMFTAHYEAVFAHDRKVAVAVQRIVNMASMNEYCLTYSFTPVNFSGEIRFITEADGTVYNYNVERYRSLTQSHVTVTDTAAEGTKSQLIAETNTSRIVIMQQAELFSETVDLTKLMTQLETNKVIQSVVVSATQGTTYTLEKSVAVQLGKSDEEQSGQSLALFQGTRFLPMYEASKAAWNKLWQETAITVDGDMMSEKMLHLHTFHMLVSGSPYANPHLDTSITARGLHGEAYRGHIFWDELFILPFYIIHFPETARQLLMYRYNRLPAAKRAAKTAGFSGAMFPWQSGLDGSEQSQELHLNPISGEWGEDHSRLQRHVSLAIAYNVWLYYHNTGDRVFMEQYGLELLLEIAVFWGSIANYDKTTERYSIEGVMGPDEFHEAYPGAAHGGLTDNAYTNMMVAWLLKELDSLCKEWDDTVICQLQKKVGVTDEMLVKMAAIRQALHLEIDEQGIIAQFAGYFDLKEIDWAAYRKTYGNIYRMDRLLRAEGHSADEYKVAKQADSLMIFYNFNKEKVDQLLKELDYQLPADYVERNLAYYLQRTSHGSTLSRVVHAQLASIVQDQELAWQLYQEALYSDYQDIQGGTTAEGIHAGVMAATLFITLTTFAGIDIRKNDVHIQPQLPKAWRRLTFRLTIRGVHYQVMMEPQQLQICADHTIGIHVAGAAYQLEANQWQKITYERAAVI